jgi:hypothetical protein
MKVLKLKFIFLTTIHEGERKEGMKDEGRQKKGKWEGRKGEREKKIRYVESDKPEFKS